MTLSERRKEKGITQEKLSEILNIDRSTVSKWETGESFPSTKYLIQLAKLYECTVDDLLRQEGEAS